jgi:DNA-binding transcriptional LysR family regulator
MLGCFQRLKEAVMKIDQLRALDAVVKGGSFAKAANEILLMTQPAVTRSIQHLEAAIGFKLFSREKYRPELTPQGEVFYQRALKILAEVDALADFSIQIATGMEPELRVSIDAYILLPKMLNAFHAIKAECLNTRLFISCETLGASLRKLLNKEADLSLILWTPEFDRHKNLESKTIQRIKAATVVAPSFPLLNKGPISPKQLAPFIQVIERTDDFHAPAVSKSEELNCQPWYVSDAHTKKQIILSGKSFGLLPYHLIQDELDKGLLVPFENLEGFQVFEREMRVARLKEREMGPVLTKLWQMLGQGI